MDIFRFRTKMYQTAIKDIKYVTVFEKKRGGGKKTKQQRETFTLKDKLYFNMERDNYTKDDLINISKEIVEASGYKGSKHHVDVTYQDIIDDRRRQERDKNAILRKEIEKIKEPTVYYL